MGRIVKEMTPDGWLVKELPDEEIQEKGQEKKDTKPVVKGEKDARPESDKPRAKKSDGKPSGGK